MKLIGMFIVACVVLSVLQAALSVLVVVGILLLIIGAFYRPAETFGLLLFGAFSTLLQTHPVGCIWLITLMLAVAFFKRERAHRGPEDHTSKTITHRPAIE
jgi:hypothetical protein